MFIMTVLRPKPSARGEYAGIGILRIPYDLRGRFAPEWRIRQILGVRQRRADTVAQVRAQAPPVPRWTNTPRHYVVRDPIAEILQPDNRVAGESFQAPMQDWHLSSGSGLRHATATAPWAM